VESVLGEAKERKGKKVVQVDLVIGSLTFLNPDQVRFWYKMLVKDTIMEGSKLVIKKQDGTVHCDKCGYNGGFQCLNDSAFHIPIPTLECPRCNGTVRIVNGKECIIKSLKLLV
jgi:hydrogenase nickel incorporation protein HypA/HybF